MTDIPSGFVRISQYDTRGPGQHRQSPGGIYAKLLRGCEAQKIRAYKDKGTWIANEADVQSWLARLEQRETPRRKAKRTAESLDASVAAAACESLASVGTTLDEIYRVLERLTAAVESIATQPKPEPAGTWRDMNGECH